MGQILLAAAVSVTVNTAPLVGSSAGPFSLVFSLTDGSGTGDANNTVTISNVTFGGGTASGGAVLLGGATGTAETAVILKDSSFLNAFIEQFTPGTQLSFSLAMTNADENGGTPDRMSFVILDGSGIPLRTLAPVGDYLLAVNLGSSAGPFELFASDPTHAPVGAVAQSLSVGVSMRGSGPAISSGGVVPIFSTTPIVEPGSWVSIYGTGLATDIATWNGDYPTILDGVTVTVNGKRAYLWFVSPTQINLQAPDDTAQGIVNVVVSNANGSFASSVTLASLGPSLSLLGDGKHVAGVILTPDGSGNYQNGAYDLVGPADAFSFNTRPVKAGEILLLFGTGFGPTMPPVAAGKTFSGAAPVTSAVLISIGGVSVAPLSAVEYASGVDQIAFAVPAAASGDQPIQVTVAGVQTPKVSVTIQ